MTFQEALGYYEAGDLRRAKRLFREIIKNRPKNFEAHYYLANILQDLGRDEESVKSYRQAMKINPDFPGTYYNVGSILKEKGDNDEALIYFQKALELDPACADIYNSIGVIYQSKGEFDDALACYQKALDADPQFALAYYNIGNAYMHLGKLREADSFFRQSLKIDPGRIRTHESLLMLMNYSDRYDAKTIFEEHLNFSRQFEMPLRVTRIYHKKERVSGRKLRIGYVSPDFRRHSVNYFLESVLASHNHDQFEIFCYSDVFRPDAVTERLRGYADQWRDIRGMPDAEVASLVRKDRVDILMDLTGHTGYNRILLFARKPAPVQVSWLGYPNTTGLSTVDYRLVDAYTDPPGLTAPFYTEKLIRLPHTFLCYLPDEGSPAVGDLPALKSGSITFGSFNFFPKISRTTVALWSAILKALPGSRLVLKAKIFSNKTACDYAMEMFTVQGIAGERVELMTQKQSFTEHLDAYNLIDIGLDTFPYHGTTTTCEALWMGVPVISLAGTTHVSRVGMSILSNVGIPELAADTGDAYVEKAVRLASDMEGLQFLRKSLRGMMSDSVLTDAKRFVPALECCYREMWGNRSNQ